MTLTFFATDTDISQIWNWLIDEPDMVVFEEYSAPDQPNQLFKTWKHLSQYLNDGGRGMIGLAAWPPSVGGRPQIEKITFEPNTQRKTKAFGRTALRSPALIHITRNNYQNGCLASAALSSWSEKGARARSIYPDEFLDAVDWKKFQSTVNKFKRQITKSSLAKLRSYPIMPDAFRKLKNNEIKLWNWGEECVYTSPLISTAENPTQSRT